MAADYEHNSRCMPMILWAMLMTFWCGLSHIGTLGFYQGTTPEVSCQDCCDQQIPNKHINQQMSSEDRKSQCHIICQNQAVQPHHINMQAEFMQRSLDANNEIESDVNTEIDTAQYSSYFSKMQKCATTTDTHDVALNDADDDDVDRRTPSAGWSNVINCLCTSLQGMLIYKLWHKISIRICISTLFDIVVLLVAQERGQRTSRTRLRQCRAISLAQSAASKLLCRCALALVLCASLKARYMMTVVWTIDSNLQKPKQHYKETTSTNYQRYLGTEVIAYIPKDMQNVKVLHTLGDGNCLWRAIARYTPHKWYTLKKRALEHMKQEALAQQDHELVAKIATLAKTNALGNHEAIMGICSFLKVNICVTTRSAVLHFGCAAGSATTFFVHLHEQHYSTTRRRDGARVYKHCCL